MKVYDLKDSEGRVFAFEISSSHLVLGRAGVRIVISRIPEVKIIRAPTYFEYSNDEVFCEFEVNGRRFEVWEPYNDNSSYWIGAEPPGWCEQLAVVRETFLNYSQWEDFKQKVMRLFR